MADGAPERLPVGVGVLLGPPVVRERDRRQRVFGLGLGVDLAQLLHGDGRLGRQFRASLQQPAAALRLEPRGAQDQRRLAVERAQGLPERLGLGVLGAERRELGGRKLAHAGHLPPDRCLRVGRRALWKDDRRDLERWIVGSETASPGRCKLPVLDVPVTIEVKLREKPLGIVDGHGGAVGRGARQDGDKLRFRDPAFPVGIEPREGGAHGGRGGVRGRGHVLQASLKG